MYIVDLAAISSVSYSWKKPAKTMAVNVEGALNIFESAKEIIPNTKILVIGSSEEYQRLMILSMKNFLLTHAARMDYRK